MMGVAHLFWRWAFNATMFKYVFKHVSFGERALTKTLTVRDEVYRKLLKVKREGESFSDLFERLVEGASPLETLKKLRGCVKFRDKEVLLREIYVARTERRL